MIERDLFGITASLLHFDNVLLHACNAVLVFFLIARLIPRIWPTETQSRYLIAGFSAVIWAFHPFRVESVAWAVERKDVLFALFYLLACHAWISHCTNKKEWKWLLMATFCFGLSCISKSMGITFPAVAFLIDYFLRRSPRIVLWDKIPLLLVMLIMLYLYGYGFTQGSEATGIDPIRSAQAVTGFFSGLPSFIQHALIASFRLCLFIAHTLVPLKSAIVYPREVFLKTIGWGIYVLPMIVILLITFGLNKNRRRSPFTFALAWFIITISPILSGEGVGTNFMSDRYTYLPSIALILALVIGITRLSARFMNTERGTALSNLITNPAIIVLSAVSITGLWATRHQIRVWRTNLSLWQQAIDNYQGNWYALYNRAKLISGEDPQHAIADLNQALKRMNGLTALYFARGTILMQQGKTQEAIIDFDRVLAQESDHAEARVNRGNSYRALGRLQEAITDYTVALHVRPRFWKAFNNRGLTYMDLGQFDKAALDFTVAITGDPTYPHPFLNRGNLRLRPEVGEFSGAIEDFTAYLNLLPQSHEALLRRGYARLHIGQGAEALRDMNEAIRLHASEGFYYIGRAQVHEALGNRDAAQRDLQKARSLGVRTSE